MAMLSHEYCSLTHVSKMFLSNCCAFYHITLTHQNMLVGLCPWQLLCSLLLQHYLGHFLISYSAISENILQGMIPLLVLFCLSEWSAGNMWYEDGGSGHPQPSWSVL